MKLALSTVVFAMLLASPAVFGQNGQVYDQRNQNQNNRVANGVQSGQLSSRQAAGLEANRAKINGEVAHDAAKNGGSLTTGEKALVHHQVNKEGHAIAYKKNVNPKGPVTK
jgi:phage protein U